VVYNGGPLDKKTQRQLIPPASGLTWTGWLSQDPRLYPSEGSPRRYIITSTPGRGDRVGRVHLVPELDVVGHRAGQHPGALGDVTDLVGPQEHFGLGHRLAVPAQPAGVVHDAGQGAQQRRLARTDRADHQDELAALDRQIHVLGAANNYQSFVLQTGTALHPTDNTWDFLVAGNRDVFAIKKANTGSGKTEIHILSHASNYQTFALQTGTALHTTDHTWAFGLTHGRDLVAIKKANTGSNSTEVHILSAASNYQAFSAQTGTGLHPTDNHFDFLVHGHDLVAIKKANTGSGHTEVHILGHGSGYKHFSLQTGTGLHNTDHTFAFGVPAQ